MGPTNALDRALSIILTAAAVVAVGVLVEGRISSSRIAVAGERIEQLGDWRARLEKVRR